VTLTGERVEPDRCPSCGSEDVRTIVYGLFDDPTSISEGVELGGCCVSPDSPAFRCGRCRHAWGTESERTEWAAVFTPRQG
jgi:hypothetical protein